MVVGRGPTSNLGYILAEMTTPKAVRLGHTKSKTFRRVNGQADKVWNVLKRINDPELGVSLVGLGLVYKVEEKNGKVKIEMSLTSMGCPLFDTIESEIKRKVKKVSGVKDVKVELVWDPPWHKDMMNEEVKAELGVD